MALKVKDEKELQISIPTGVLSKPKKVKKILDEDTYADSLEKIIVRDFYPDLPKLEAQAEYLDAVQRNDTVKLREIHIKYGPKRGSMQTPSIYSTPATFETPEARLKQTPKEPDKSGQEGGGMEGESGHLEGPTHNPEPNQDKEKAVPVSLDKFLAGTTSEDNAAFEDMMAEANQKHRVKHDWLFERQLEQEKLQAEQLMLPGIEKQAITHGSQQVQGWTYTPRNAVMYVPDGCELSAKEKIENGGASREIIHDNTRFKMNPFNLEKSRVQLSEAATEQAQNLMGRLGADGKEILPQTTPTINGFGFVATPSPAPGVDASPMMTWGEIDGTPFRLDGGDTPLPQKTSGPTFRIPDVPRRDKLLHALAEKTTKGHRLKKQQTLQRVTANFSSPSPKFGAASKTERLLGLSPAAQKLASAKLGIRTTTDKALRASYTPSPSRLPGDNTPLSLTPRSSRRTPKGATPGKGSTRAGSTPLVKATPERTTPKRTSTEGLTDNLLNLPKRTKALDYF